MGDELRSGRRLGGWYGPRKKFSKEVAAEELRLLKEQILIVGPILERFPTRDESGQVQSWRKIRYSFVGGGLVTDPRKSVSEGISEGFPRTHFVPYWVEWDTHSERFRGVSIEHYPDCIYITVFAHAYYSNKDLNELADLLRAHTGITVDLEYHRYPDSSGDVEDYLNPGPPTYG
jgi:hypothetical protein